MTIAIIAATAAYFDALQGKIPNALTLAGTAGALAHFSLTHGLSGLGFSLAGLGVGLGLLIVPYAVGQLAAGDVKLAATLGAWLGPYMILWALTLTILLGGVYGAFQIVRTGLAREALGRLWGHVSLARSQGGLVPAGVSGLAAARGGWRTERLPRIRFGVVMAWGTLLALELAEPLGRALFARN